MLHSLMANYRMSLRANFLTLYYLWPQQAVLRLSRGGRSHWWVTICNTVVSRKRADGRYTLLCVQTEEWADICNITAFTSLEPRPSVPDFVSQLWRKIVGRAWNDFSRDTVAPWHSDLPDVKVTRHMECACYCQRSEGKRCKTTSKTT